MNQFDFKNRTAVVTGGAQGFGLDISKRFLKCGAKVIMWDNDPKALEKAVKNINSPNLSYNNVNVSNYEEVSTNIDEITKNTLLIFLQNSPHDRPENQCI